MKDQGQEMISAQVVLRPAGGKSLREMPPPTAAQLGQYLPSPKDAEAAMRVFREAGFQVGPLVGISFSIAAPLAAFESFFGARLRRTKNRGLKVAGGEGEGYELPLDALPPEAARLIEVVTFTPPPDFGPAGSGP